MSLPRYDEYKDSGIEWIGPIPSNWNILRLKTQFVLVTEKAIQRSNCISLENIASWSGLFLPTVSEFEGDGVAFAKGDILFGKLRPYLAKVYLATDDGEAVGDLFVLRSKANTDGGFAQYQMLSREFIEIIDSSTFGSKMPRASWDALGNMPFVLPSPIEQSAIATFLDHETAKIDALIAEQEKLIALLAEKRQATISHAVTRGLNPDVPMKDSGVAWLGEVPAHWASWKVRNAFEYIGSGTTPPSDEAQWYEGGTTPWVTTGELRETVIAETAKTLTDEALSRFTALKVHPAGALVVAMYGATIGRLGILGVPAATNQACCTLFGERGLTVKFTYYWLMAFKEKVIALYATGGGQPNISQEVIAGLRVPAPGTQDQQEIAKFLDREVGRFAALVSEAEQVVSLLKERRSALIAAAVTGQIDVRGWTPNN